MTPLERLVAAELSRPAPAPVEAITRAVLARWGDAVSCILFYGSCRRDPQAGGMVDLYVLTDSYRRLHRGRAASAVFNRLLPPNVVFLTAATDGGTVAAKVAVMSRRAFSRRMRPGSLDTTLWTRFCQPASLVYAKDPAVADWTMATVAIGLRTAVGWAARLSGPAASPNERWCTLFAETYRLEIRPEAADRSGLLYRSASSWFEAVSVAVDDRSVSAHNSSWAIRRAIGKPLNIMRLIKAAFTFDGGADYLSDKLERHTGIAIVPTGWQQRHPLLGAPSLLLRHRQLRRRTMKPTVKNR